MADALISVFLEPLAKVVYQQTTEAVSLVLNAKQDVESFKRKLATITAVLEDAERRQVKEAEVADWLKRLKDVSFEMDDVLDEWNYELLRQQVEEKQKEEGGNPIISTKKKVCFPMPSACFCSGQVTKVIHHHSIATRIKKLNAKLTLIADERAMFRFDKSTVRVDDDPHLKSTSFVDISTIFGREEEKQMLLSKLLRESNQDGGRFLIIPIVGMGGMGKTALTQLVYNDQKVAAHFDKKVWVCVSEPFDEIKIAKAIIESLDKNESQRSSNELETLLLCIRSHVENKKFLLVLDDVWTEDQNKWDNFKLPLIMRSCEEGSTILVTTRKEGVAAIMGATSSMIQLDKLNENDSLTLFNNTAFLDRREDEANGFGAIGEEIVKKAKGLPLAVKTLGSLVRCKKTREEWRDILNSKIWELEEFEQQVFQPLLLSYYDLAPAVKMCLMYCAIFPKDYILSKGQLIELWMSQDYLNSKKNKGKGRIGQDYFESLAMRSFFQDFKKDETGNVYACKMHDIVHDFVQFLTKKECIIIDVVGGAYERIELPGDTVRHLTLTSVGSSISFYNCKNMRSLALFPFSWGTLMTTIPSSILEMKCLRTLTLSQNSFTQLPKEIGELIHLRYLDLSYSVVLKEIPDSVCNLYNLQTLNLTNCIQLEKLPKAMGKLISLRHLYVSSCFDLHLPKGIVSLKCLQVLDYFREWEGDDEALQVEDLGIMDQLQGSLEIRIQSSSQLEKARLGNKEHVSQLYVGTQHQEGEIRTGDSEIVKAMQPHPNLESLTISNYHWTTASLYWINSLHNLKKLELFANPFCEVLPPLGKLPSLEILGIGVMKNVKRVGVEFLGIEEDETKTRIMFPKLKRLVLEDLENWEEWEGIRNDSSKVIIMPHLSYLEIRECPKLKALPDFLYKIATLSTLEIRASSILEREYNKAPHEKILAPPLFPSCASDTLMLILSFTFFQNFLSLYHIYLQPEMKLS